MLKHTRNHGAQKQGQNPQTKCKNVKEDIKEIAIKITEQQKVKK